MRALSYIARRNGSIVSVSEIARKLKMPRAFLRKILQILQKKGLLTSFDGRRGGFRLAMPAEKIFVVDLIKIFQGPVRLTDCLLKERICPAMRRCLLKKKVKQLEELIISELKSLTIASLLNNSEKKRGSDGTLS
jgi:Rrf2 family protein